MLTALILATMPMSACRVVDGDSIVCNRERIRLLDIDAAETEQARCPAERARGDAATAALRRMLGNGMIEIERDGRDGYGRTLALVRVNGPDVGAAMVAGGYARPYAGGRRPWC